jgi:hypothetical protein
MTCQSHGYTNRSLCCEATLSSRSMTDSATMDDVSIETTSKRIKPSRPRQGLASTPEFNRPLHKLKHARSVATPCVQYRAQHELSTPYTNLRINDTILISMGNNHYGSASIVGLRYIPSSKSWRISAKRASNTIVIINEDKVWVID